MAYPLHSYKGQGIHVNVHVHADTLSAELAHTCILHVHVHVRDVHNVYNYMHMALWLVFGGREPPDVVFCIIEKESCYNIIHEYTYLAIVLENKPMFRA